MRLAVLPPDLRRHFEMKYARPLQALRTALVPVLKIPAYPSLPPPGADGPYSYFLIGGSSIPFASPAMPEVATSMQRRSTGSRMEK